MSKRKNASRLADTATVCDTDVPGWELTLGFREGTEGYDRATVTFGPAAPIVAAGPPPVCPVVVETSVPAEVRLIESFLTDEPDAETGDDVTDEDVAALLDWLADKDPLARDLLDRLRANRE